MQYLFLYSLSTPTVTLIVHIFTLFYLPNTFSSVFFLLFSLHDSILTHSFVYLPDY